jgi:hypothetical protein
VRVGTGAALVADALVGAGSVVGADAVGVTTGLDADVVAAAAAVEPEP